MNTVASKKRRGRPAVAEPRIFKVVTHLTAVEKEALEEFRLDQAYQPDTATVLHLWIRQRLIQEGRLPGRTPTITD